jgi:hypothetical protein
MTEDEIMYCFITGLQTEAKLQVELQRPNDLQIAKEIADRADTNIFQAKRFSRGKDGPLSDTASGNWPSQDGEAMKLGATRLTDSEREKYTKERKCFRCGKKGHRSNQHNADGSPPKKLDFPGHSPPGHKESYQERKITQQKNDKKERTSALHSRYDALKETHERDEKGHEEISSSENGTQRYQNVTETEKRKTTSARQKTL